MQSAGTRRANARRRVSKKPADTRLGIKRLFIYSAAATSLAAAGYLFVVMGGGAALGGWTQNRAIGLASSAGYRLENIYVEGRKYTDSDVIRSILGVQRGDPLFAFDPHAAQDMMMKVSWIKDAQIERRMPGTIYVKITERTPLALWQQGRKVRVIDDEGAVLTSDLRLFVKLPLVVGDDANKKAKDLLALLSAEPDLLSRVEAAQLLGTRRWDLTMQGGVIIKLPEENMGLAIRKLADSQRDDGLLDKDVAQVDLREADRLIVRTKPGAVREYKAAFKPGDKEL